MESLHLSSPNVASLTNGENLWLGKHSIKNIYHPSSYPLKISQHKRKLQTKCNYLRFRQPMLNHHYRCTAEGTTHQDCDEQHVAKVTTSSFSDSDQPHASNAKTMSHFIKKLSVFYKFVDPHNSLTIHLIDALCATLHAVEKLTDISPLFLIGVLQVAIPNILLGVFVSSMNQLTDFEIDKINKPHRILTSGELSYTTGVIITTSSFILSLWAASVIGSWPLIWGIVLNCFVSIAYSLNVPFLRWKGNPFLAAMTIFVTWTFLFPVSSFIHMQTFVFKRPLIFPRSMVFLVTFTSLYSLSIALLKDVPDVEGDMAFGINSFAARFGQKPVFQISVFLLKMAFGVALLAGATSSSIWMKIVTTVGHVILTSVLWYRAKSTNLSIKSSLVSFYSLIWKLFTAESLLMPFVR